METDVHASRDGVAIISHDSDLSRVAGLAGLVSDFTLAELHKVDLGHGQSIVSLGETLEAFPEARFNIDIKSDDAIVPTAKAILRYGATHRVLISSFSENRRRQTVKLLPGVATSASRSGVIRAVLSANRGLTWATKRALQGIDAVQIPVRFREIGRASCRERVF